MPIAMVVVGGPAPPGSVLGHFQCGGASEAAAARLGERLEGLRLAVRLTSPLGRASVRRTLARAGTGGGPVLFPRDGQPPRGGYEHERSDPVIRLWDEMPRERRISPALVRESRETARR